MWFMYLPCFQTLISQTGKKTKHLHKHEPFQKIVKIIDINYLLLYIKTP